MSENESRHQHNQQAKAHALESVKSLSGNTTHLINYNSSGRLLIIIPEITPVDTLSIPTQLNTTIMVTDTGDNGIETIAGQPCHIFYSQQMPISIKGHLGNFDITLQANSETLHLHTLVDKNSGIFDLVIDLSSSPLIDAQIPPFGYCALNQMDTDEINAQLLSFSELIGHFEKPKFFNYNPDICAHGYSGIQGCSNCIDACPTDAISSLGELIDVNPYWCQGGGSCASACPSGAITYNYPSTDIFIQHIQQLVQAYNKSGGQSASLLFYNQEQESSPPFNDDQLASHIIPVQVEEIGFIGSDILLNCIAMGVDNIYLLNDGKQAEKILNTLNTQITFATKILNAFSIDNTQLQIVTPDASVLSREVETSSTRTIPLYFATHENKRLRLFSIIDHFYQHTEHKPDWLALNEDDAFGRLDIDPESCTLCMSCTSVCPANALMDGGSQPKLSFIESSCLQCGLCAKACPESALTLQPGFTFDVAKRQQPTTLKQEEPFHCISCGKAFATQSMIATITAKLSSHWMYQDEAATNRLKMCEDCRVIDAMDMNSSDKSTIN